MEENTIEPKIKANAVTAYFLIGISFLFLFNKTNKYINNDFVRSHTKTAFFIHISLLFFWFIIFKFSFNSFLSTIISTIVFLFAASLLFLGIYKASKGETFKIIDVVHISKVNKFANIQKHMENDEKNKFSFFLSYIPFVSYLLYPLLDSNEVYNKVFKNNIRINLLISLFLCLVYINGNTDITLILMLIYIVFVVFSSLILVIQNNLMFIYIEYLNKIENLEIYIKSYVQYFKNYTKGSFINLKDLISKNILTEKTKLQEEENILKSQKDTVLPKFLIYVPIINFIFLFSFDTKYRNHIINGISLSILTLFMLGIFRTVNSTFILLLYPICFGIGNLNLKLAYKQTFIFHIFNVFIVIKTKIKKLNGKIKETKKTVQTSSFKIGEDQKETVLKPETEKNNTIENSVNLNNS
ncbi:MAG: hypothetical protein PHN31_06430 [Candidatus Gracilibacteria bacterium]|nr:hypothetical protein [Candidatus Gracilibacteria bacterium]